MPFTKGKSGNPNGRKVGTPNGVTGALRERVQRLLESQFERVVLDMESLEPKERVNAWLKLAEYVLPKLNRSEVLIDQETNLPATFDVERLTTEESALLLDLIDKAQGEAALIRPPV